MVSYRPRVRRTFAVLLIPLALAGCASSSKKTASATATTASSSSTAKAPTTTAKASGYKVGDTAKTDNFDVTVYEVKDPAAPDHDFDKPKAGNHYVAVDVQVMNHSKDQQLFSSGLGFHLLDGQNRQYDETIADISPKAPDGQIAAGQAIRGWVVFDVPDGTAGLKLKVQGGLTAAGAVFVLS